MTKKIVVVRFIGIYKPTGKHYLPILAKAIMKAQSLVKALPIVVPFTALIARFGKLPIRMKSPLSRGAKPS